MASVTILSDNGATSGSSGFKTSGGNDGTLLLQTTTSGGTPTTAITIDNTQNVGVGVVPSAWGGTYKAAQIGTATAVWGSTGANHDTNIGSNIYFNGTNNLYITSDYATQYQQYQGKHQWFTAASGTAGATISFTQAMTLDASGNLGVGTTSPNRPLTVNGVLNLTDGSTDKALSFYSSTYGYVLQNTQAGPITLWTNGSERARIDSSGNLGLGVVPSAWAAALTGTLENRSGGMYPYNPGGGGYDLGIFANAYYDGNWRYKNSSSSAAYYLSATTSSTSTLQRHVWRTAAPGTAGNAITYVDAMFLDAGGRKTTPLQPGFQAYALSVTDFNASTGATACLKGGTIPYNQGSCYDSTTGRFTAPVAGTYIFTSGILVATGTGRMEAALYFNGTQVIAMNGTGTTYDGPVLTTVIKMAQSDYVTIGRVSGTAYTSPHNNTYFTGYLLG